MFKICLVEDGRNARELSVHAIQGCKRLEVAGVYGTGEEALRKVPKVKPDVVLMDIKLPGMSGIECLAALRHLSPPFNRPVIILTEHEGADLIFEALKAGANGYLLKRHASGQELQAAIMEVMAGGGPMSPSVARKVIDLFHHGAADVWLAPLREAEALGRTSQCLELCPGEPYDSVPKLKAALGLQGFVGESPALMAEIQKIPAIARCNVSVLIRGETGTGKEICARAIHNLSARRGQPFVPLNCAALPQDLIENELFGHESGAFTSANAAAVGIIEQADGGTLVLDEIDVLPLSAQVKLLRFLQDKQYRRLGSQKVQTADVRIAAATNADLDQSVRAGRFRQDLLYRLNVVELVLPPLRERAGDVELLARHFLNRFAAEFGKPASTFTIEAVRKLKFYPWPGNVRELENVVARAVVLSHQPVIYPGEIVLPATERSSGVSTFKESKAQAIRTFERQYLMELLCSHRGNVSKAACASGKERRTFWQLLRKHKLTDANRRPTLS